jgi:GNAT superfamily N-acetyltransferase
MTMTQPVIQARPVTGADFWRVREFLVNTVPIAPPAHNWDARWWDGQHFYNPSGQWEGGWEQGVRVWEDYGATAAGEVVACANWEHRGDAYLQVHPAYRFLEREMLDWAEGALAETRPDGRCSLEVLTFEYDARRQALLAERGYERTAAGGMVRQMRMPAQPLPRPALAAPYTLREVDAADDADCQRIADLLNAAFKRTFHNAAEFKMFATRAPCYLKALDLAAVAPDGSFAAYVGMPYDAANRLAIFEPVCCHPEHLRRGLASALMFEALARAREIGAARALVGTGDAVAANGLYDSMGFTEAYRQVVWRKVW